MGEAALQLHGGGSGERGATRALLRALWNQHFVPRRLRDAGEWAEAEVTLSTEETEEAGPFRLSRTPYARFILKLLSAHCLTRTVSFRAPAQVMKTLAGLIFVGQRVHEHPCRVWMVFPTDILAKDFKRDRWDVFVDGTAALRKLIPRQRSREGSQTKAYVKFPGGSLKFVGANVPWALRSTPVKVLVLEEYNALSRSLKGEGTAAGIAKARTRRVRRAKIYENSTPTIAGASAITDALRDAEATFEFRVPCPHCGHLQVLTREQLRYDKPEKRRDGGKLDSIAGVTVECIGCHAPIEERHKRRMAREALAFGEDGWHAKWDLGRKSVGIDGASLALLAEKPWGDIAAKYEQGLENAEVMREVMNLDLGLDFEEESDAPDVHDLYERREPYPPGVIPPGARMLVAGVDVQGAQGKTWLAVETVAYGRNWESWSIDYRVIVGDLSDPRGGAWKDLCEQVLDVDWPCHGGGTLPIRVMAVDSGHRADDVYAFARSRGQDHQVKPDPKGKGFKVKHDRTVMVVKGRDPYDKLVGTAQAVSDDEKKRGVKVFLVGVGKLRETQYEWWKIPPLTDAERAAGDRPPRGLCHYPDDGDAANGTWTRDYFAECTNARLLTVMVRGYPQRKWDKPKNLRHEAGDCRVYARAAGIVLGVERARESDWRALEARLPPGLLEAGAAAPTPAPMRQVAQPEPTHEALAPPPARAATPGAPASVGRRFVNTYLNG